VALLLPEAVRTASCYTTTIRNIYVRSNPTKHEAARGGTTMGRTENGSTGDCVNPTQWRPGKYKCSRGRVCTRSATVNRRVSRV